MRSINLLFCAIFCTLPLRIHATNAATPTYPIRTFPAVAFVHPAVVVPKFRTNAHRLSAGFAPAAPAHLRRVARDKRLARRTNSAAPSSTPTPTPSPPVCVVTTDATPLWDSSNDIDDQYKQIDLPFWVQMYDENSRTVFVSTNGVYSLLAGTTAYRNSKLPVGSDFPVYSVLPFWDDTFIYAGTQQRIYYSIINGNRIIVEFLLSQYGAATEYYHYTVDYSTDTPSVFVVKYYSVSDSGASATVGAQGMCHGKQIFMQYSFNQPVITPGLMLTIDTIANTVTPGHFNLSADSSCA
ncbi:hypothetical protein C8R43DRAFT_1234444 [Mycena crocata]|nr:hypothetical protein C8R43DRAFT_1234444 [Mycena crocata]